MPGLKKGARSIRATLRLSSWDCFRLNDWGLCSKRKLRNTGVGFWKTIGVPYVPARCQCWRDFSRICGGRSGFQRRRKIGYYVGRESEQSSRRLGRNDANFIQIILNKSILAFTSLPQQRSVLLVWGDVRGLSVLNKGSESDILIGRYELPLKTLQIAKKRQAKRGKNCIFTRL